MDLSSDVIPLEIHKTYDFRSKENLKTNENINVQINSEIGAYTNTNEFRDTGSFLT